MKFIIFVVVLLFWITNREYRYAQKKLGMNKDGIFIGNNRHNKIGPTTCRTVYCQHKIFVELYQTVEHKF